MTDSVEASIEDVLSEILEEYGCDDWESCEGKKMEIVKKLAEKGFSEEEIATVLNRDVNIIKSMLVRTGVLGDAKHSKQRTKARVEDLIEDDVKMVYEKEPTVSDIGVLIDHPYSDYIPEKVIIRGRVYTRDELVEELGMSGLRLLKIDALSRVLKYGPSFRATPDKFVRAISQHLLMNPQIVDNYQLLSSLLKTYKIESNLEALAMSVLSYLDQMYRPIAESVESVPPVMSWVAVEKDGNVVFYPTNPTNPSNQTITPSNLYSNPYNPQANYPTTPTFPYNAPTNPQTYPTYPNPFIPQQPQPTPIMAPSYPTQTPAQLEELKKKDEEIRELKSMIQQLLQEKEEKEREEREKERLKAISELIEQKISSISSRLSLLESKLTNPPKNEEDVLRQTISDLKDELKELRNEMTKKEIEALKATLSSLEKKLESGFPNTLNQYMAEFAIKRLESEAEIAKVQKQAEMLENAIEKLKSTFTVAAESFGRAIGKELITTPQTPQPTSRNKEPEQILITVCPDCGTKLSVPANYKKLVCPTCGKLIDERESVGSVKSEDKEGKEGKEGEEGEEGEEPPRAAVKSKKSGLDKEVE